MYVIDTLRQGEYSEQALRVLVSPTDNTSETIWQSSGSRRAEYQEPRALALHPRDGTAYVIGDSLSVAHTFLVTIVDVATGAVRSVTEYTSIELEHAEVAVSATIDDALNLWILFYGYREGTGAIHVERWSVSSPSGALTDGVVAFKQSTPFETVSQGVTTDGTRVFVVYTPFYSHSASLKVYELFAGGEDTIMLIDQAGGEDPVSPRHRSLLTFDHCSGRLLSLTHPFRDEFPRPTWIGYAVPRADAPNLPLTTIDVIVMPLPSPVTHVVAADVDRRNLSTCVGRWVAPASGTIKHAIASLASTGSDPTDVVWRVHRRLVDKNDDDDDDDDDNNTHCPALPCVCEQFAHSRRPACEIRARLRQPSRLTLLRSRVLEPAPVSVDDLSEGAVLTPLWSQEGSGTELPRACAYRPGTTHLFIARQSDIVVVDTAAGEVVSSSLAWGTMNPPSLTFLDPHRVLVAEFEARDDHTTAYLRLLHLNKDGSLATHPAPQTVWTLDAPTDELLGGLGVAHGAGRTFVHMRTEQGGRDGNVFTDRLYELSPSSPHNLLMPWTGCLRVDHSVRDWYRGHAFQHALEYDECTQTLLMMKIPTISEPSITEWTYVVYSVPLPAPGAPVASEYNESVLFMNTAVDMQGITLRDFAVPRGGLAYFACDDECCLVRAGDVIEVSAPRASSCARGLTAQVTLCSPCAPCLLEKPVLCDRRAD